jgi:hypothetical protein
VFERYGCAAARDRAYVDACYERVRAMMQAELDDLVQKYDCLEAKEKGFCPVPIK